MKSMLFEITIEAKELEKNELVQLLAVKNLNFKIKEITPDEPVKPTISIAEKLRDKKLGKLGTDVLLLLVEGNSYDEIADKLQITKDGVRYYIKRIYKKLGVNNGREAIRLFYELTESSN